jgi:hypothetical protein
MSGMARLGEKNACARCGSDTEVQVVKYLRGQERRTEPWCSQCRERKLSRLGSDAPVRRRRSSKVFATAALLLLVIAGLGTIVLVVA